MAWRLTPKYHKKGGAQAAEGNKLYCDVLDVKSGACFGGARNVLELELERQGVKEE